MNVLFGEKQKNWYPVSLGFNCHVKVLVEQICQIDGIRYPRLPFDWIGTPMSSVYEMTISNFDEMNTPSKLVVRKRFEDKPTEYLTHTDYNFVFVHDYKNIHDISEEVYTKVANDYVRRIERWNTLLSCGKHILFLRLEQDAANRIAYPGTERPYDEYTYLQMFADHMKSRHVQFHIVYFSQTRAQEHDKEHNIITINFKKDKPDTIVSGEHLGCILRAHSSFIQSCFSM